MANDLLIKVQVQSDSAIAALNKLDNSMKSLQRTMNDTFKVDDIAEKASTSLFKYDGALKNVNSTFSNLKTSSDTFTRSLTATEKIGNVADKVDKLGGAGLRLAADFGVSNDAVFKAGQALTGVGDVIDKTLQSGFNPLALGITAVSVAVPILISAFSEQKRSIEDITKDVESLNTAYKTLEDTQREIAYSETMSKLFAKDLSALQGYQKNVKNLQKEVAKEYIETFSAKNLSGKAQAEYKKIEQATTDLALQMARAAQFGVVGMEKTISETQLKLSDMFSETNATALASDEAVKKMVTSYQQMGVDVSAFTVLANVFGNDTYKAMIKAAEGNEFLQNKMKSFEEIIQKNIDAVKKESDIDKGRNKAALDNTETLRQKQIQYYQSLDSYDKIVNNNIIDRDQYLTAFRTQNARALEKELKKPVGSIKVDNAGLLEANKLYKFSEQEKLAIKIENSRIAKEIDNDYTKSYIEAITAINDANKEIQPIQQKEYGFFSEASLAKLDKARTGMQEIAFESITMDAALSAMNGTGQVLAETFYQFGEALTASGEAQKNLGEIFLQNAGKMAAGVIKQVAMQAMVKAVWETAEGIAALANPILAAATGNNPALHFAAAAKYATIGAVAGIAGGALGGLTGGGGSQSAPKDTTTRQTTERVTGVGSTANTTINLYGDLYQNDLEKMKRQQEMLNSQLMQAG